jgi:hypothetical protein
MRSAEGHNPKMKKPDIAGFKKIKIPAGHLWEWLTFSPWLRFSRLERLKPNCFYLPYTALFDEHYCLSPTRKPPDGTIPQGRFCFQLLNQTIREGSPAA